jgi:energy-converting hydrogenase Eha subunit A
VALPRHEALAPAGDRVEIVRAELGTAAGVIGAALVAYDELGLLERSVQ